MLNTPKVEVNGKHFIINFTTVHVKHSKGFNKPQTNSTELMSNILRLDYHLYRVYHPHASCLS
jgi:hypothetical protein